MSSPWIRHVKQYASDNDVSYRDAMKLSKSSYQGGDFNSAMRKARNTTKRVAKGVRNASGKASKFIDKNEHYLSYIDPELGSNLRDVSQGLKGVNGASQRAVDATGGSMKLKNIGRKIRNTAKKASSSMDFINPLVDMVNPELGASIHATNMALKLGTRNGGSFKAGSFKTAGGSFKTAGGGKIGHQCPHCGQRGGSVGFGRSQSSIISSTHNSFAPLKPKSYKQLQMTN